MSYFKYFSENTLRIAKCVKAGTLYPKIPDLVPDREKHINVFLSLAWQTYNFLEGSYIFPKDPSTYIYTCIFLTQELYFFCYIFNNISKVNPQ